MYLPYVRWNVQITILHQRYLNQEIVLFLHVRNHLFLYELKYCNFNISHAPLMIWICNLVAWMFFFNPWISIKKTTRERRILILYLRYGSKSTIVWTFFLDLSLLIINNLLILLWYLKLFCFYWCDFNWTCQ